MGTGLAGDAPGVKAGARIVSDCDGGAALTYDGCGGGAAYDNCEAGTAANDGCGGGCANESGGVLATETS
jgi:hypothetical protein